MSRILTGVQEPKLTLAHRLARALGVTLDFLVDDEQAIGRPGRVVTVSEDEWTILAIARRLGTEAAIDRLLRVSPTDRPGANGGDVGARGATGPGRSGPG